MSYRIVSRKTLNPSIILLEIEYPQLARAARPGNFVVVKVDEYGERIPLTIVDRDEKLGTIKIIYQIVGASTRKLALLDQGDTIMDLVGPLGKPTHIARVGTVVCVGGGVAPVLPIARAMKVRRKQRAEGDSLTTGGTRSVASLLIFTSTLSRTSALLYHHLTIDMQSCPINRVAPPFFFLSPPVSVRGTSSSPRRSFLITSWVLKTNTRSI